jgi:hypothetical protein
LASATPSDDELLDKLDSQWQNGGMLQYFWNTRGEHASETLAALQLRGCTDHARVFAEAIARFEKERPGLEAEWRLFDRPPWDANRYGVVEQRSAISALDDGWAALPPLRG